MSSVNLEWNVCRVCLQESDDMTSIFDESGAHIKIFEKIMQCSSVVVKPNMNLPELICKICLTNLEVAYQFRNNCESSDAILNSIIESASSSSEMSVNISTGEIYKFRPPSGLKVCKTTATATATKSPIEAQSSRVDFNTKQMLILPKEEIIDDQDFMVTESAAEDLDDESLKDEEIATYEIDPKFTEEEEEEEEEIEEIHNIDDDDNEDDEYNDENVSYKIIYVQQSKRKNSKSPGKVTRTKTEPKTLKTCEICGHSFKYRYAYTNHMRRHRNERPFVCKICNKGFVINIELSRHMRTHTGQKPYSCKYCDRKFSDFGSSKKHERTHTGERPYACETCGKTFAYSHVLSSHMSVHNGIKNFECDICTRRFAKAHHLKSHKNTHERCRLLRGPKSIVSGDKKPKLS